MIACPVRLRPRDFDALDLFAEENEGLTTMAEDVAWGMSDGQRFSWGTFFAMLREFRARY